jgi:hypothetical protein
MRAATKDAFDRRFIAQAKLNIAALALERQRSTIEAIHGLVLQDVGIASQLGQAVTSGCKFLSV